MAKADGDGLRRGRAGLRIWALSHVNKMMYAWLLLVVHFVNLLTPFVHSPPSKTGSARSLRGLLARCPWIEFWEKVCSLL